MQHLSFWKAGNSINHQKIPCKYTAKLFGSDLPLLQDTSNKKLASFIRAAHQRATCCIQESHRVSYFFPVMKFWWCNIFYHLKMPFCWLHVLPQCDTVDTSCLQVWNRPKKLRSSEVSAVMLVDGIQTQNMINIIQSTQAIRYS